MLLYLGAILFTLLAAAHAVGVHSNLTCHVTKEQSYRCQVGVRCEPGSSTSGAVVGTLVENVQCDHLTRILWEGARAGDRLNVKLSAKNRTDFRACLGKPADSLSTSHYDVTTGDQYPILNRWRSKAQPSAETRQRCVTSHHGSVLFGLIANQDGDVVEDIYFLSEGADPHNDTSSSCKGDVQDCQLTVMNCPGEKRGHLEFAWPADCDFVNVQWHYSWSTSLDMTTWLPGKPRDFQLCAHNSRTAGAF